MKMDRHKAIYNVCWLNAASYVPYLSGCGIRARCLPSAEHSAAIPAGDPFGFMG
jgi:hypothetical protein